MGAFDGQISVTVANEPPPQSSEPGDVTDDGYIVTAPTVAMPSMLLTSGTIWIPDNQVDKAVEHGWEVGARTCHGLTQVRR
jgi:hypothetical protein